MDRPRLYVLHSTIEVDGREVDNDETTFGIRSLEYSASEGFLLNGQHVKMNGVCLHHDGGCVGAAVPLEIWRERLILLKAMGCNAIRTSHNPPAPEFLDLCDRMGFLVMDEAFDAWESGKVKYDYSQYFDEWWERDVTDQVRRDRNHPSVVLWSAGNEIPDQTKDKGVELLKAAMAVFHREDPTRPVTTANDDIAADNGATKMAFLEAEDIIGYNYVDRWHERRELFYDEDRYQHPDWKVIGTESGSVHEPLAELYSMGSDPARVRGQLYVRNDCRRTTLEVHRGTSLCHWRFHVDGRGLSGRGDMALQECLPIRGSSTDRMFPRMPTTFIKVNGRPNPSSISCPIGTGRAGRARWSRSWRIRIAIPWSFS